MLVPGAEVRVDEMQDVYFLATSWFIFKNTEFSIKGFSCSTKTGNFVFHFGNSIQMNFCLFL